MAEIRYRGEGAAPTRDRTGTGLRRHQGGAGALVHVGYRRLFYLMSIISKIKKGEPLKAPPSLSLWSMLRLAHDADAANEPARVSALVVAEGELNILELAFRHLGDAQDLLVALEDFPDATGADGMAE